LPFTIHPRCSSILLRGWFLCNVLFGRNSSLTRGFDFRCLKQKEAEEGGEPHLTIPAAPLCPAGFDAKAVSQPLPGQIARYTGWRKIHRPPTGRCAVTGKELWLDEIHCHHKLPIHLGGSDKYENLVIVHENVHRLIHATAPETIERYLNLIRPDKKTLAKINALRIMAGNSKI